jgi:hypothetical protein
MPSSGIAHFLEAPDDGMAYMSYSEFDAGLVCVNCMKAELMRPRCSSVSSESDSDLLTQDQYFEDGLQNEPVSCADGIALALKLSAMEAKLLRANRTLTHCGPVEETACQALLDVAMEGLGLGRRSAGKFYTADVEKLRHAKDALFLALRAVDKLPRSYNTASHLPVMCRESLGTSWTEIAVAVVHDYACVCLASANWSQAAAACRRLLEADGGQRMTAKYLAFCRRLCTPSARAASPLHDALARCPDFREFRAGWLDQAVRRGSQAADLLFAGRARGPLTCAVLASFMDDVRQWPRSILSFAATEDGLRCFGCGAGSSDCVCGGDSVSVVQPTSVPPPLEIEQKVLPNLGSAVQICGLTSAVGKQLNGCLGTVIALEASSRLRIRVGPRATTEKAIKRECTRLTLLSPQFVGRTEDQQRGSIHPHSLSWLPPFADVSDSAPSARATNGSDDHSSTSAASMRASYVAGYCTRGKPTPTINRRGGRTAGAQKKRT